MEASQTYTYRFPIKEEKAWKDHLEEHGFVVVSGVISEDVSKSILKEMKQTLTKLSPDLKLSDEKAWADSKNYPYMFKKGIIDYIAHANFQWTLREKATSVFSKIYDVNPTELATSFEGFCYMDGRRGYEPPSSLIEWVHSDQSPLKNYLWSVQGLFSLCDNGPNDGGLVVVPKSHKIHNEFFNQIGKGDFEEDWYPFKQKETTDPIFKTAIKICGKAGDFMMWDSRTFHCNTVPTTNNSRACVYVCQIPKKEVRVESRYVRREAWVNKRCASHHPGDGKLFPVLPEKADPKLLEIIKTVSIKEGDLNELRKSLLCLDDDLTY